MLGTTKQKDTAASSTWVALSAQESESLLVRALAVHALWLSSSILKAQIWTGEKLTSYVMHGHVSMGTSGMAVAYLLRQAAVYESLCSGWATVTSETGICFLIQV